MQVPQVRQELGILGTTAGNLVGAGTLVGGPSMLPMTGGYGPERRQGGLMDPRNYGMYGQSSPRNNSLNGQSFQGLTSCTGCGFQQGACQGFGGSRAVEFSRVHAKVFNKDVKDFKVAQAVEFSKVHVWELHVQVKAVVKECHVFQVKDET